MTKAAKSFVPKRVVLVLQGGGALGAYQWGVFEALSQSGIAIDWVIGTSIGAINAALIAGNPPELRNERLGVFWDKVAQRASGGSFGWLGLGQAFANLATVTRGIPSFFEPHSTALRGPRAVVGVEQASYYSTDPLRRTLDQLMSFDTLNTSSTRVTVGAVNVCSGAMRYFDSRDEPLGLDHVMASGALPPAFPAVRIGGQAYWDGGLYSNTPIEAVLDDNPRRDSLVFAVNVWHESGPEPQSIQEVLGRQKDIQYASRTDSHIGKQKQLHRLRHVIRELEQQLPASRRSTAVVQELASWGCCTTMHIARLVAPRLDGEDSTKDIDFTLAGIQARREAGYADTIRMIERAPWNDPVNPIEGLVEHR